MRDRLIELLQEASAEAGKHFRETTKKVFAEKGRFNSAEDIDRRNIYEIEADYLLANGVIVPPCKVGQSIYRISNNGNEIYGDWQIVKLAVYEDEMGFVDDSDNWIAFEDIGKTVFLTREEAEAKLKEGVKG